MTTTIDLDQAIREQVIAVYELYADLADDPVLAARYRERAEALRRAHD